MKSKIYIITHKKIPISYDDNLYYPIQVGKKFTNLELNYQTDDVNENISEKNKNYCELTGIYWILKNRNLEDYIGICHYRRYFVKKLSNKLIDEKYINKNMKKYDIILPKRFFFKYSMWDNYFKNGNGKEADLIKLKKIIEEDYPELLSTFNKVLDRKSGSYCNMFIMKRKDFEEYHNWLFEILGKLEKITDLSNYTKEEARIYGYLSELLINVWVEYKSLKVKYTKINKIDNSIKDNIKWNIIMIKGRIQGFLSNKY